MSIRSPHLHARWRVHPKLVRVLGSATEAYLRSRPDRTFEFTPDTFEFLAAFASARRLSDVLPDPSSEQLAVVDELVTLGVLVPADDRVRQEPPSPRPEPVPQRFARAQAWKHNETANHPGAIVVLGAKFDGGTLERYRKGAAAGPDLLRAASQDYPLVPRLRDGIALGFPDVETGRWLASGVELFDAGNLVHPAGCPVVSWMQGLTRAIASIRRRHGQTLLFGGDHSVTAAALAAHNETPIGVLQLDAHTDFGLIDHEGHLHHANVMRHAVAFPHVQHVVLCGVRGFQQRPCDEGFAQHESYSVATLRSMIEADRRRVLRPELPYYVSVDVDVLDPSIVPGTTVPEPDGFGLLELRRLLRALLEGRRILGADLVEVQSDAQAQMTARSALHVAFELIDLMHHDRVL